MSRTPPELVRFTFPDRRALELEIATNLRYGQAFTREVLQVPPLTEGVIVIVHPVSQRELRLPAEVVMVNGDGEMRGTGFALRAFGRTELEKLEAFAREAGPAAAPSRAVSTETPRAAPAAPSSGEISPPVRTSPVAPTGRSHTASSGVQPAAVQRAAPTDRRPGASSPAVRRPGQGVDATATRAHGLSQAKNAVVPRPAQELDGRQGADRHPQPAASRARASSSGSNAGVRRPIQEINRTDEGRHAGSDARAEPTRRRDMRSQTNAALQRPVQEINRTDVEDKRERPPSQPMAARPHSASSAVSAAVTRPGQAPDPAAVAPARAGASPWPAPASRPAQPAAAEAHAANLSVSEQVEADDWSDFEHEPDAPKLEPAAEPPTATQAMPPVPAPAAVDEDDWSDFEHGPEPDAVIPQANVAQPENAPLQAASAPKPPPEAEQPEVDGSTIPYDLAAAADRAPSPAFVSNPHTAVTRPPPKDDA